MPIRLIVVILLFISGTTATTAQKSITEITEGMEKYEGYFDFWWDEDKGKIWLQIDKLDEEVLYVNSLAAGMGSNDIGLDRSQLGNSRIIIFKRIGPRVLMIQPNYDFRASTDNRLEKKSVDEAFAQSVLWGFEITTSENGRLLVDATDFLLRDAHDVTGRLRSGNQGTYSLDKSRSAVYLPGTFNFPENSEIETILTFAGENPGTHVRSVTPTPQAITVRQHHSFVKLPDDNYRPRKLDPRSGYFGISYQDYSAPIGDELTKRYIVRHRLEKKNPDAEISEAVEPIIFYLDNGTPEPIRSALLDGARWWAEAFEEIGYRDAFRVEVLPDDAHPLDVRFNVINWVHRSTRGWSYGSSVIDPRTGEIIKGNVLLGSLRVRQDYLIAEGLLAPYKDGIIPDDDPMLDMALARIRQLSAHEIGHTLGIAHNFAASVNNRASVMDYPHPKVDINPDGSFDLSNAYSIGIGEWDKRAVAYGYQDFPAGINENDALNDIINETIDMGLLYISDRDARPQGGAHPDAHLWDNNNDPIEELYHVMDVRRRALDQFSENNIRPGRTMSELEDVLVPVYLFHRYQTEATVKLLGGVDYNYNIRGNGQAGPRIVSAGEQRKALDALLLTLSPGELALPQQILNLIPPRAAGISNTRELFRGYTAPVLDPAALAEVAADLTSSLIFTPERAARLVNQHARNSANPGLIEIIDKIVDSTIFAKQKGDYESAILRSINTAIMRNILTLAGKSTAAPDVRALVNYKLDLMSELLTEKMNNEKLPVVKSHYMFMHDMIKTYRTNPEKFELPETPYTPPGSPIGSGEDFTLKCNFKN
ncbi:MAG: zinc-dependent metalloprotease [Balneolaceae bacterium]